MKQQPKVLPLQAVIIETNQSNSFETIVYPIISAERALDYVIDNSPYSDSMQRASIPAACILDIISSSTAIGKAIEYYHNLPKEDQKQYKVIPALNRMKSLKSLQETSNAVDALQSAVDAIKGDARLYRAANIFLKHASISTTPAIQELYQKLVDCGLQYDPFHVVGGES